MKVDQHYGNLSLRQPSNIIGSSEWSHKHHLDEVKRTGVVREFKDGRNFNNKYTQQQMKAESELITKCCNKKNIKNNPESAINILYPIEL